MALEFSSRALSKETHSVTLNDLGLNLRKWPKRRESKAHGPALIVVCSPDLGFKGRRSLIMTPLKLNGADGSGCLGLLSSEPGTRDGHEHCQDRENEGGAR